MISSQVHRAIIRISVSGKSITKSNYSRRMYAIIRRYTPNAVEGGINECFAELTGLRTFFKMTYTELADAISSDLFTEIGIHCVVKVATPLQFSQALNGMRKTKTVSTYKEINSLFAGHSFVSAPLRRTTSLGRAAKKIRLIVPFLGKVA
jgi:hypothetical protein